MTVRIDEELLAQLKKAAQEEERSLSAYVLRILRQHALQHASATKPGKPKKSVMGSLRHLGAPESLSDFQAVRRQASKKIAKGLDRTIELLDRQ